MSAQSARSRSACGTHSARNATKGFKSIAPSPASAIGGCEGFVSTDCAAMPRRRVVTRPDGSGAAGSTISASVAAREVRFSSLAKRPSAAKRPASGPGLKSATWPRCEPHVRKFRTSEYEPLPLQRCQSTKFEGRTVYRRSQPPMPRPDASRCPDKEADVARLRLAEC
jgi:hypothetical protein